MNAYGRRGIGKTQTAVEYIYRHVADYGASGAQTGGARRPHAFPVVAITGNGELG